MLRLVFDETEVGFSHGDAYWGLVLEDPENPWNRRPAGIRVMATNHPFFGKYDEGKYTEQQRLFAKELCRRFNEMGGLIDKVLEEQA